MRRVETRMTGLRLNPRTHAPDSSLETRSSGARPVPRTAVHSFRPALYRFVDAERSTLDVGNQAHGVKEASETEQHDSEPRPGETSDEPIRGCGQEQCGRVGVDGGCQRRAGQFDGDRREVRERERQHAAERQPPDGVTRRGVQSRGGAQQQRGHPGDGQPLPDAGDDRTHFALPDPLVLLPRGGSCGRWPDSSSSSRTRFRSCSSMRS